MMYLDGYKKNSEESENFKRSQWILINCEQKADEVTKKSIYVCILPRIKKLEKRELEKQNWKGNEMNGNRQTLPKN
jgi:hypothetical protein